MVPCVSAAAPDDKPQAPLWKVGMVWQVLRRNPELAKAMLASGVQRADVSLAMTMCISNLRPMIWGSHMAEYTATISMTLNIVAVCTSGAFGRFGDRAGRRAAAVAFGFASFLPAWALLVFGFNERGLWASSAAFVVSGVGLSSDALLVLANEVTIPEDRSLAFGMFQAATNLLTFILFGIPAFVISTSHAIEGPSPMDWLLYHLVLSGVYFIAVGTIRMPSKVCTAGSDASSCDENIGKEAGEGTCQDSQAATAQQVEGSCFWQFAMSVVSPALIAWNHEALRRLCLSGVLLAFCGDIAFDIGSQYFRDELDLLEHGTFHEQQRVSVLTTLPPTILMIPASLLVGLLAQKFGSLPLLKALIPASAIMMAAGALMALAPQLWMVPVVCLAQNFASLAGNIPLKYLVAEAAPEGRVGEAMGALGMLMQGTSLVCNAIVAAVTPILYRHLTKPLWIYYLACGFLTLLGAIPLRGLILSSSASGKAAAEDAEDLRSAGV